MQNRTFRRFVAIFVGILLIIAIPAAIFVGDEKMFGMTIAVAVIYVIYLILLFKKEKQEKTNQKKKVDSPLMRK